MYQAGNEICDSCSGTLASKQIVRTRRRAADHSSGGSQEEDQFEAKLVILPQKFTPPDAGLPMSSASGAAKFLSIAASGCQSGE